MSQSEWTLSEIARFLDEPEHRLIYLCEKEVVAPDYGDAEGRGSSRRFSERNLLEFVLALRLRELTISAGAIGAILYVLRAFEKSLRQEISGFELVRSLRADNAPDLRVIVSDGERLYFSLCGAKGKPKLYGGIDFKKLTEEKSRVSLSRV